MASNPYGINNRGNNNRQNNNNNNNDADDPENNSFIQLIPRSLFRSNPYTPVNRNDEVENPPAAANPAANFNNPQANDAPTNNNPQNLQTQMLHDPDDVEDDEFENRLFGGINNNNNFMAEQARRQRILRLALIMCIFFLFMDGNQRNAAGRKKDNGPTIPTDEIVLPSQDINDIRSVFLPLRPVNFKRQNVTGSYRGEWQNIFYANHSHSSEKHKGVSTLQFRTINLYHVPDLSFVYGLTQVGENGHLQKDLTYPFQGVLITSLRKVFLMPTPYKTQRLMMEITKTPQATASPTLMPTAAVTSTSKSFSAYPLKRQRAQRNLLAKPEIQEVKKSFPYYDEIDYSLTKNSSIIISPPHSEISLRIYLVDTFDHALNLSTTADATTANPRTFILGESFLSPRFKLFQVSHPPKILEEIFQAINETLSHKDDNDKSKKPNFLSSTMSSLVNTVATVTKPLIENVYDNPNCPYLLELSVRDEKFEEPYWASSNWISSPFIDYSKPPVKNDENPSSTPSHESDKRTSNILLKDESIPEHVAPAIELGGHIRNCENYYGVSAVSFEKDFEVIKEKVEIYSIIYTLLSLLQIGLIIYQMKHCTSQVFYSKMSLFSLLGQSVLDAVICLFHLLMSIILPSIFFGSFIWIGIIKLLLFSVFEMKMAINIYHARYAQEIANEGWRGMRQRIVNLHLRFYGVLLLVFLLATTFSIAPIFLVILFYSYLWPQIFHSAYYGTKHSLHPYYLYGMTISRLFLPLYFIGCPKNFFIILYRDFVLVELAQPHSGSSSDNTNTPGFYSESATYFLLIWLFLQVMILQLQTMFGPRFFIPKRYLPYRYDYKRPIPLSLLQRNAAGTIHNPVHPQNHPPGHPHHPHDPLEDIESNVDGTVAGDRHECIICYNVIEYQSSLNADYMITPCDHLFHEECLRQWMNVKLECPVCRAVLPALDEDESS